MTTTPLASNPLIPRHLLQIAGFASLTVGLDGIIISVDNRAAAMTGQPAAALSGQLYFSLFPDIIQVQLQTYWTALTTDGSFTLDAPLLTITGDLRETRQIVVLSDTLVEVLLQDLTSYRQTQEQLSQRVQQLTMLSEIEAELADRLDIDYVLNMALDTTVRLSEASAGFIALVEDKTLQNLRFIGEYPHATLTAYLRRNMGTVARTIRTGQEVLITDVNSDPDYIELRADTVSQMVVPLVSRDRMVGILNLETDRHGRFTPQKLEFIHLVTARIAVAIDNAWLYRQTVKQLDELRGLYDRVSKLEALKTDMIRIASHDLRNPLSVVLSYSGMLVNMMKGGDPTPLEYVKNMELAARQMRKLTMDILSLERIEEAAAEASMETCDLKMLVEQVFVEEQPATRLKQQKYELQIDTVRALTRGDPVQLSEAIRNLISNAIKYTRPGGQITVKLSRVDDRLNFKVEDNGYGIKEEQQGRLFQAFFRARSAETRDEEGTGLGLHLVKNIIERHNGSLIFHSEYGKGSLFGFELPAY